MSGHELINPPGMAPAVGFSHVAVAAPGRLVLLAGQTAHQADGSVLGTTVEAQFAAAVDNVVAALAAAGAQPAHVVSLQIFTSDVDAYKAALGPIGRAYKAAFGGHYPPMALFGVTRLFDEAAVVELVVTAVIPS